VGPFGAEEGFFRRTFFFVGLVGSLLLPLFLAVAAAADAAALGFGAEAAALALVDMMLWIQSVN
jgi:hypothetical protein